MSSEEITKLTEQVARLREQLTEARRREAAQPVGAYTFHDEDGRPVTLSDVGGWSPRHAYRDRPSAVGA
jgi:hypothetical protein